MVSWVKSFQFKSFPATKSSRPQGQVLFLGKNDSRRVREWIQQKALDWQKEMLLKQERELIYFIGHEGPVWIFRPVKKFSAWSAQNFNETEYSWARDTLGTLLMQLKAHQLEQVGMEFSGTTPQQELGALVGFDLAAYSFRSVNESKSEKFPEVFLKKSKGTFSTKIVDEAMARSSAINSARHFVNLPPNQLNPKSFSEMAKKFPWSKKSKIEIWNLQKIEKEKMGLLLGVGQGSLTPPSMVHICYRPSSAKKKSPIAFVGKGITFDTGGLDLKPSAGMRLMKKDMGGAATVLALAQWVDQVGLPQPCDFYLALAENSVSGNSFRPSDVLVARNGMRVEIDNTDAEGRLVLGDVIDVAISGKEQPSIIIDVATLTGAIKTALGSEVAGLFSNDDGLAKDLQQAGWRAGDWNWRMPLVDKYSAQLYSPFADCKNSSEGFGGAITAALFLKKFVGTKKWAHLDIYAWTDKGGGPLAGGQANGQAVQCLMEYLSRA